MNEIIIIIAGIMIATTIVIMITMKQMIDAAHKASMDEWEDEWKEDERFIFEIK